MAHEIGSMFWHGEKPWHDKGRKVASRLTVEQALVEGGLDWEVEAVPLATAESPPSPTAHRVAIVRRDRPPGHPGRVVGVVHPGFRPLQNREGAMLFDRLFDPGGAKYETGGSLRNGEVVWLLARLPGEITVGGRDVLETYLLYSNSHDGSQAIDIRLTAVRVVCRNTLSLALARGGARAFRRAHRFDAGMLETDAKAFLQLASKRAAAVGDAARRLAAARCDDAAFAAFLRRLVPDPAPAAARAPTQAAERRIERLAQQRAQILGVRRDGIPAAAVPPEPASWWGAVNAVTAWVDHVQPIRGDRHAHALFGGDRLKSAALDGALAEIGMPALAHGAESAVTA